MKDEQYVDKYMATIRKQADKSNLFLSAADTKKWITSAYLRISHCRTTLPQHTPVKDAKVDFIYGWLERKDFVQD